MDSPRSSPSSTAYAEPDQIRALADFEFAPRPTVDDLDDLWHAELVARRQRAVGQPVPESLNTLPLHTRPKAAAGLSWGETFVAWLCLMVPLWSVSGYALRAIGDASVAPNHVAHFVGSVVVSLCIVLLATARSRMAARKGRAATVRVDEAAAPLPDCGQPGCSRCSA